MRTLLRWLMSFLGEPQGKHVRRTPAAVHPPRPAVRPVPVVDPANVVAEQVAIVRPYLVALERSAR